MNPTRQFLKILLITLTLCGVQVIQASPLHDHVGHISGCSLCHYDSGQAVQAASSLHSPLPASAAPTQPGAIASPISRPYPPFQGRAPPITAL